MAGGLALVHELSQSCNFLLVLLVGSADLDELQHSGCLAVDVIGGLVDFEVSVSFENLFGPLDVGHDCKQWHTQQGFEFLLCVVFPGQVLVYYR